MVPVAGGAAIGRYHHYDGYPAGLGTSLLLAQRDNFKTIAEMVQVLVFDHPAGWSTINGADWTLTPGTATNTNDNERECVVCGKSHWKHYRQYYGGYTYPDATLPDDAAEGTMVLGHQPKAVELATDRRPSCYCHNGEGEPNHTDHLSLILCRHDDGQQCRGGSDCDPLWIEWTYHLKPEGIGVWTSGEVGEGYAHHYLDTVPWDTADPAKAMAAIEGAWYDSEKA
jgi:hypothetical protein